MKCNEDDTIGDLKKLIAAQVGTRPEKIRIQKWYTVYKVIYLILPHRSDRVISLSALARPAARCPDGVTAVMTWRCAWGLKDRGIRGGIHAVCLLPSKCALGFVCGGWSDAQNID